MARADRHQPLADIAAGRDAHAQAVAGILAHEPPIGAEQEAALRLAHGEEIADRAVALAIPDLARRRRDLGREQAEQRRLARARFADHRDDLALMDIEADIDAADPAAVGLAEAMDG